MTFMCTIDMDNAAFEDGDDTNHYELRRLLGSIPARIKEGKREGTVMDINGNRVGSWGIR